MVHVDPSKWTVHPACVKGVTPTRFVPSAGKTWTLRAIGGRCGSGRSAVWVEVIVWLFATVTVTGVLVGWRFGSDVFAEK